MIIGFYSINFAYRRLNRPGMSVQMRHLFLKKHAIYVFILIIFQLIQLLYNYFELFNLFDRETIERMKEADNTKKFKIIQHISIIAILITGFILGVIRLYDPIFRLMLK